MTRRKPAFEGFGTRQSIRAAERDMFLGSDKTFQKFKDQMAEPLKVKDRSGDDRLAHFVCNQPLQIRIMGDLDKVRDISKDIMEEFDISATDIGLSKLECDKSNRVGHYCKNTIRAYFNIGSGKLGCNKYYDD